MVTAVLICFGIIMIYSSSSIYAWDKLGDTAFFLKRQIMYVLLGFIFSLLVMSLDYRKLREFSRPLLLVALVLLLFLLIPGVAREIAGAKRWFRLFGYSFQPSEFAKIAIIFYMADFLSRRSNRLNNFFLGFLPAMVVLGLFILAILMQPDLGTAVAITVIVFVMLFVAGVRLAHLFSIILLALPAFYFLIARVPYRMMRIKAFLNPWIDPKGSGFQIIQSQLALGSGGILGVGLGQSKQKLFYLPAAHTDFIFSIIGEELGFLGTAAVAVLFIIFIWLAWRIMKNAPDNFGKLLSLGLITMIGFEAIVNMGVSTASLPTKGLPLPFISYGGSSLIFNMVSVGILLNISKSKAI
jgi:cell division protein FtsW